MLSTFLILQVRHPWCWIAKRYPRYIRDVEAGVILELSDALPCKLKGLIVRYFLLIIPLCAWKKQSCYQWNLEFVEIEYFQDWPKINYGVKNVAFFSPSHAAQMKSSEAFSHNTLVPCFPFNKASSRRMWHNWFLGFGDLEMAGIQERKGNSSRVIV